MHGRRADGIVKSMREHSRGVSGEPSADLISAWQRACHIRARRPDAVFIAGEMLSATIGTTR
jgi:hypothetical protein